MKTNWARNLNLTNWTFLLLCFLFVVPRTFAQELRGEIVGLVRDDTGGLLTGVQVTAVSPALIRERVTTTGSDGRYRVAALPPGMYTLVFKFPSFRTLQREKIRVGFKMHISINATLELAGVEETLTVTEHSPLVDIKTTTVGTSLTNELLEDIPTARDIWSAMALTPGFQMAGYDVGGSHTGTQTPYITYGFEGQNKTLLEGINVTENQDLNAGYFDYGSFQELQLGGTGNMAEQAGPGALLNISVKSGGDKFSGNVYTDFLNKDTVSDNVPGELKIPGGTVDGFRAPAKGLSRGNPITKQYDINFGVGGPIFRQKLWFYFSYRQNNQFKSILGMDEEAQSKLENFTFKGTYQINASNQIIGFFNRRTKFQPLRGLSLTTAKESAHFQDSVNRPWKIEWTSILSERTILDVQFSSWLNFFPLYPTQTQSSSVDGVPPGRIELTTGQRSGGHNFYWERRVDKPQISASLLHDWDGWSGNHHFKVGGELYRERREVFRFQPFDIFYRDRKGKPWEIDLYNTESRGTNDAHHLSLYAQDSWLASERLSLNLGIRYDIYRLAWPEQRVESNRSDMFPTTSTMPTTVRTYHSVSPRLGLALDLTGNGNTTLKVFFGRFFFNPSIYHTDKENPVGNLRFRHRFNDLNGNNILDSPDELGDFLRSLDGAGFFKVDRDIKHAYADELSTHFERELAENLYLRTSYVYKNLRQGWGLVDVSRVDTYNIPVTLIDQLTGTTLELLDRERNVPEEVLFTNPGRMGLPDYSADYHTIETTLHRRLKNNWLVLSSFEHTWASDFRENRQFSTSNLHVARHRACGLGQFECSNLWTPNARRFGKLNSTWWNFKFVGRYLFNYGISVSAAYKYQSGLNYARLMNVNLPNAGTETILSEPIADNRSPGVGILDLRGEKSFNLAGRIGQVTGILDIFNLFNTNPVTNFRMMSGSRFKEVITLLDPRTIRLGIRWEF